MNILYLFQLAQRLENFSIDNGPMGESRPFADDARKLREFANEVSLATIDNPGPRTPRPSGDFRDAPWESR
jgi:hypothetical protein